MASLKDYATGTVLTAPSPATSGTSLVLASGLGARFPTAPFYVTAHPDFQLPTLDNAEKLLVTAKSTDTLTITRAQGDTTAKSIAVGWRISNAVFKDDLFTGSVITGELPSGSINGSNTAFTVASAFSSGSLRVFLNGQRLRSGSGNDYVESANLIGFTMEYAPATGDILVVDYMIGTSVYMNGTNSFITSETPTGSVNSSNAVFTTLRPYVANTLEVYVNGLKQERTTHVTETTPTVGTFTLDLAPTTGDIVRVSYQFASSAGGNADTVDGANASVSPTSGMIPILDAYGSMVASHHDNLIINGGCEVAQRAAPTLSTSSQYGKVDRYRVHATGTAVSAGSITQGTAQNISSTSCTLAVTGVTITGSGILFVKYRMESKDALKLKNQTASFRCSVVHVVGSAVNYIITIRKPTVADNFASVTDISTTTISVSNATARTIALENVSMGDCSNGVEIEIQVVCGAVTTKDFNFANFQINVGAVANTFVVKTFAEEIRNCQRYYEKSYDYSVAPGTASSAGTWHGFAETAFRARAGSQRFSAGKRTGPTVTLYSDNTGTSGKVRDNTGSADITSAGNGIGTSAFYIDLQGNATAGREYTAQWVAEAEL